jgi:hypothetical protein
MVTARPQRRANVQMLPERSASGITKQSPPSRSPPKFAGVGSLRVAVDPVRLLYGAAVERGREPQRGEQTKFA